MSLKTSYMSCIWNIIFTIKNSTDTKHKIMNGATLKSFLLKGMEIRVFWNECSLKWRYMNTLASEFTEFVQQLVQAYTKEYIRGPHIPISQIPQCIRQISHNAPFCNRNISAHFCFKMVYCGIFVECIVVFVQQLYHWLLVRRIHLSPVYSPHKGPVIWKVFPCDDVTILCRTAAYIGHYTYFFQRHVISYGWLSNSSLWEHIGCDRAMRRPPR